MFGYVRPHPPELKVKEYELYRSVYCGVCRSLGACTGKCSRVCLSYDAVFLSLFYINTLPQALTFQRRRCIAHPLKKRNMLTPCEATDYAARVNAALAHYHTLDDLQDCRGLRRLCTGFVKPWTKRWHKKAKLDQQLVVQIEQALKEQSELERSKCASADQAAQPYGKLLSSIFAYAIRKEPLQRIAAEFGLHIGRCIYLIDAAEDYEKDKKRGQYNPFALAGDSPQKNHALWTSVRIELQQAANAFDLLPHQDTAVTAILENILYDGLPRRINAVLQMEQSDSTCSEERERI